MVKMYKSTQKDEYLEETSNADIIMTNTNEPRASNGRKFIIKRRKRPKVELSDLDKILNSLELDQWSNRINKKLLRQNQNTNNYYCSVCKVNISNPESDIELRFNIWDHISGYDHKRRLHNFPEQVNEICNAVKEVMKKMDTNYCNPFIVGPAQGFLMCTVCFCAVPSDPYHIKIHLCEKYHQENINKMVELSNCPTESRSFYLKIQTESLLKKQKELNNLKSILPEELRMDENYLNEGCVPGYVVCKLCSKAIISTSFYLESHLFDFTHQKYKICPFEIKSTCEEDPILTKIKLNGPFSPSGMSHFLTLVLQCSNDSFLKNNSKFLFKKYMKDCYFCCLCKTEFVEDSSGSLYHKFRCHCKEESHIKHSTHNLKNEVEDASSFAVLEVFTEDVLADVKYISVPKPENEQMLCSLCETILSPVDLIVLTDHIQSKQHAKNKNIAINTAKSNDFTVESVFQDLIKNLEGKNANQFLKADDLKFQEIFKKNKKLVDKQFYKLQESKVVCQLCESVVGRYQGELHDLQHKLTEHVLMKKHKKLVDNYLEHVKQQEKERETALAKMMEQFSDMDKNSRRCFKICKKPGFVKCRACKVKVSMESEIIQTHVSEAVHKENILMIKGQKSFQKL